MILKAPPPILSMAFFKKTFLLAFLNNAELKIASYAESSGVVRRIGLDTIDFSGDIVRDSTILSASLFYERLAEFLKTKSEWAGMGVVLVIPEEKIYIKGFELDLGDWERKDELFADFKKNVPFLEEELILRERLVGRVLEFSAVQRQFLEDLKKPFVEFRMHCAGVISVPHASAIVFAPKDRSFLLSLYDNDFTMMLAENSSVLISGTKRMAQMNVKEAIKAFHRFVKYAKADHIKSVSIIVGDAALVDDVKAELERSFYAINEIKKIHILDLIASYYHEHKKERKEWDMLYAESAASRDCSAGRNLKRISLLSVSVLVLVGSAWYGIEYYLRNRDMAPASVPPAAESVSVPQATSTPATQVKNKIDFPIAIENGNMVVGEAGRLLFFFFFQHFTLSTYAFTVAVAATIFKCHS